MMRPGDVVGERFEIERSIGEGGMGRVFRAIDRVTGAAVATKVLLRESSLSRTRFEREARILAELRHPAIVRHVAHGETKAGEPYLVMEWIDGEDLGSRLQRGMLSVEESVAVTTRVAEALAVMHRRGLIHRDLKPSNLLLVNGQLDALRVIDFGIARDTDDGAFATNSVEIVGTPAYMAPEQASGERLLTPRVDVFALGAILFECLAGVPAFRGENALAVLAKILIADRPMMAEMRADVPAALAALVQRMLSWDPMRRPADGGEVVAELEALSRTTATQSAPSASARQGDPNANVTLTTVERRVASVVIVRPEQPTRPRDPHADTTQSQSAVAAYRNEVEAGGGSFSLLFDGSILVTITGGGAATDQAARAAHCALHLRAVLPTRPMALSTGRGEITWKLPLGDVIDRATARLVELERRGSAGGAAFGVALDGVTAGLLESRFDVRRGDDGPYLVGERTTFDEPRPVLGRSTACVGRDRELARLQQVFAECVDEAEAHAVLVVATAGVGKSRLAAEFLQWVRRHEQFVEVWTARGDPFAHGSAFSLLGQALRGACGIRAGASLDERRWKLRTRVGRHVAPADRQRVLEFLGELASTPVSDERSTALHAAHEDAQIMREQTVRAWEDFLDAECAANPVLLVLDDLHWGDLPTTRLICAALRALQRRPFMVLALGQPDMRERFPELWTERRTEVAHLTALSPRSSRHLVQQVLGDALSPAQLERLVSQADGNAFYLEELIRAAADGRAAAPPETVVAVVQSRLEQLEGPARRVLRAASIFGDVFWPGGVAALLGEAEGPVIEPWISELVARELLLPRPASRFIGEPELAFRHALLREGAYAMLTERDRELGHRLAGAWLAQHGESDPALLAQHFERGGDPAAAVSHYLHAAEQALRGDDQEAAIARAERGAACGALGETLGEIRRIQAEAHLWRGELARAEERSVEALGLLRTGTASWFRAMCQVVIAAGKLGETERVERYGIEASAGAPAADTPSALGAKIVCLSECATHLIFGGRYEAADRLLGALSGMAGAPAALDPLAAAALCQVHGIRALLAGEPVKCIGGLTAALDAAVRAGHRRGACTIRTNLGFVLSELGDFERAERILRAALDDTSRMGIHDLTTAVLHNLGRVVACRGDIEEGKHLEEQAIEAFERQGNMRMAGSARGYLAQILILAGDMIAAEREARLALEMLEPAPPLRAVARATLGRALLGQGRVHEAVESARASMAELASLGELEEGEAQVRLVLAEALSSAGRAAEAAQVIAAAYERLIARAARITDERLRERFLAAVPENARTVALFRTQPPSQRTHAGARTSSSDTT